MTKQFTLCDKPKDCRDCPYYHDGCDGQPEENAEELQNTINRVYFMALSVYRESKKNGKECTISFRKFCDIIHADSADAVLNAMNELEWLYYTFPEEKLKLKVFSIQGTNDEVHTITFTSPAFAHITK